MLKFRAISDESVKRLWATFLLHVHVYLAAQLCVISAINVSRS